ncbi:lipid IV(A) 3-deoxy-D-manno-octulosonic acid transferase [Sulfurimonas sp. HSL-3221]|uniref:lipid IV(A) 3-deoxy-D-manno-octulosonic acid transferase n=1 Tax=Sulfurimonadaceae TaxID=2771471 RepID=UPI001E378D0B|nr:lipid IV(A) 3-deoxy-D-manno-octulosonic acid transferase [Sulfurimonas sp. HSL-3221]UFS63022.1 lipid IV(A) 3-deoxy-D-manno-octulosonic acid transferase [Sulfurimonas sp. HSL-3221]
MKPFSLIYFLLSALLYVAALPLLLLFSLRSKYRESLPARFFLKGNPPFTPGGIWFHACSVGETRALKPLLAPLSPEEVRISTITQTGQDVARGYGSEHRYLPYELFMPFWVKPQRALVVLEAEFWYLLFAVARARGAKVVLLNARLSERSFPRYLKLRWFYRRLFARVDKIFCQSAADKARFEQLGASNIEVIGNIKLAQSVTTTKTYAKPEGETIVAASTHEGEEAMILEAFRARHAEHPDSRLLVVPRHPERFDAVWELLHGQCDGERIARWSTDGGIDALGEHPVVLVDAMGELNNLYAISDIAVLGGAFKADVGGHNPLEPAHFGCRTLSGSHFFNQRELMRYVDNIAVVENDALTEALLHAEGLRPASINGSVDLQPFFDYLTKESAS